MAESKEQLKSLLMKVKEESEKVDLKPHIQKTKILYIIVLVLPNIKMNLPQFKNKIKLIKKKLVNNIQCL